MWGAVMGGMASMATSYFQNQSAKHAAKRQMDFQERMSNTAHQREVQDLMNARLNPVLSATGGGASSPIGAMSQPLDLSETVPNALKASMNQKEKEQIDANIDTTKATKAKMEQDKLTAKAEQRYLENLGTATKDANDRENAIQAVTLPAVTATSANTIIQQNREAELNKIRTEMDKTTTGRTLNAIGEAFNRVGGSPISALSNIFKGGGSKINKTYNNYKSYHR